MSVEYLSKQNSKIFELIFISVFWVLLFISPLIFQCINKSSVNWSVIFSVWLGYLPLLVVFCINRCVLIPQILFKSRLPLYLISVAVLISLTVLAKTFVRQDFTSKKSTPVHGQALLHFPDSSKAPNPNRPRNIKPQMSPTPPYINLILLSILLVGFDTGTKLSVKWAQAEGQKAQLEKDNIKNELAFLRHQVSPHFFMNTLNNIHALIDFDTKEAKSSVVKLSVLMRYLLYESDKDPTTLAKEINFIESYIKLMELRYSDDVDIQFVKPEDIPDLSIPPLLFTNIIENAFKHGINPEKKSFVKITLLLHDKQLEFYTLNSLHKDTGVEKQSGIGIKNTEKRLQLLYNTDYTFTNTESNNVFRSTIKIPV